MKYICAMHFHVLFLTNKITDALVVDMIHSSHPFLLALTLPNLEFVKSFKPVRFQIFSI